MPTPTIYQFGKRGEDQRLMVRDGVVYVFDWSGDRPEETDDGPLVVEASSICTLVTSLGSDVQVSVPVRSKRDDQVYRCTMSLKCFDTLRTLVDDLRLTESPDFRRLAIQVMDAQRIRLSSP